MEQEATALEARNETRISYLEGAIAKILDNIDRLEGHIINNNSKQTPWVGIFTVFLTGLIILGTGTSFLIGYVDGEVADSERRLEAEITNLKAEDDRLEEKVVLLRETQNEKFEVFTEFRTQTHYEMGVQHTNDEEIKKSIDLVRAEIERLESVIWGVK